MKMKKILIYVVVGLFVLGIVKDQIVRIAATVVVSQVTGAPCRIGGLSLGIFSQSMRITGFKLYQPKGFVAKDVL